MIQKYNLNEAVFENLSYSDVPLQEALWVCFVIKLSPFDANNESPVEGEPRLAHQCEQPREPMVVEREEAIDEEREKEEEEYKFHCACYRVLARGFFMKREREGINGHWSNLTNTW